ncbi:hypothetical protein MD21A_iyMicDemo21aOGSv2.0-000274 [Microplitis demolitor]
MDSSERNDPVKKSTEVNEESPEVDECKRPENKAAMILKSPGNDSNDNGLDGAEKVDFEYKKLAVSYWRDNKSANEQRKRKSRSLESVIDKYPHVKSLSQLYEWERAIKNSGTRFDKLKLIAKHVYDKFKTETSFYNIVRDKDIHKWALEANEDIKLKDFVASRSWILLFKRSHKISLKELNKSIKSMKKD